MIEIVDLEGDAWLVDHDTGVVYLDEHCPALDVPYYMFHAMQALLGGAQRKRHLRLVH